MASRVRRPKPRVIVAEENIESRTAVCAMITRLNCLAVSALSASDTLKAIKRCHVDRGLLDLALTWADGEDTLAEVKRVVPMLPVVIMSHLVTPALARRRCDRGAQSFLVKPVRRDQLAVTLLRHLL